MGRTDTARNVVMIALLAVLAFSWSRTLALHFSQQPNYLENRTGMFRGYDAFADRAINFTVAENWGMERAINDNDVAMWVEVNPSELQVGDIIMFRDTSTGGGPLIAHRILEVVDGSFRTKGDALPTADPNLVGAELEGIVIGVVYHEAT